MDRAALAVSTASFWARVLPAIPNQAWLDEMHQIAFDAEPRRSVADYDTGSILESEAYALRALAEYIQARVVIEVGTFIGASTCALASASSVERVYTCDVSNDCLDSHGKIKTFPKQTSTQMLRKLDGWGARADLCFFDGALNADDVDLLARVCGHATVFAVHDYNYGPKIRKHGMETVPRKGIGNVGLLKRMWPTHIVIDPRPGETLAVLVQESWL